MVARDTGATIIVAPQFTDIKTICEQVDIPVFSQHVDSVRSGAFTGHVVAEAVKSSGATGTLLNHSERRIDQAQLHDALSIARETNLVTLVCADTPIKSREVSLLNPDLVAIEPPELIGTGIAVSSAKPEIVTKSVTEVHKVNGKLHVLCGAGISNAHDVEKAIELGTRGVLVASSIVKAKNPESVIREMAAALLKE